MYKEYLQQKINKVINDELTSSIIYLKMADSLSGINVSEVSEILKEHANEEFEHFARIQRFALSHGITPCIAINTEKINSAPKDLINVILTTQSLEQEAITDYTQMTKKAQEHGDVETMSFFKELMNTEIEHFDELAPFLGQTRELPACDKEETILNIEPQAQPVQEQPRVVRLKDLFNL